MPRYELVLEGVLGDESIAELTGFSATREDNTTVLRGELSSQDDLVGVLEAFEALGLGLQRLCRVRPSED
jgi:hypothetical protein